MFKGLPIFKKGPIIPNSNLENWLAISFQIVTLEKQGTLENDLWGEWPVFKKNPKFLSLLSFLNLLSCLLPTYMIKQVLGTFWYVTDHPKTQWLKTIIFQYLLWTELFSPCSPNSYVETLTFNGLLFGDRTFKEVIKVKWCRKGGPLIQ